MTMPLMSSPTLGAAIGLGNCVHEASYPQDTEFFLCNVVGLALNEPYIHGVTGAS